MDMNAVKRDCGIMVETANDRRIPLKTDNYFNANDFMQTEIGTVKELMVTITLREYRELLTMKQYQSDRAERMVNELTELREKLYAKD